MSKSHLINANKHRAKEGARVLEDIARFLLRDITLIEKARAVRHQIHLSDPIYQVKDDLYGIGFVENNVRHHLMSIIQANACRLQEALRVLEELTQTPQEKALMKELRYRAYDLHAQLYQAAKRYLKQNLLEGLYLIIDTDVISSPLEEIIEIINHSPVNIVQYRNKNAAKKIICKHAEKIKQKLDAKKLLIINDHIDIALDLGDGLHLGQDDYPLDRIRNIIPDNFILGISCHNLKEAGVAEKVGASYIAMGCLFETNSKNDITRISIHELQTVANAVSVPVCAIGGINRHNLDQALTAHIKMAALISYPWTTNYPLEAIKNMHETIINALDSKKSDDVNLLNSN